MKFFLRFSLDMAGFYTSAICAVHCFLVPVLLMVTGIQALEWFHHPLVEYGFILLSMVLAGSSFIASRKKGHRNAAAFWCLSVGFIFIALSRLGVSPFFEILLTTGGALTVAAAHIINWRICRSSHV